MRFQYSTRPPLNPASQPVTSRFSVHLADVCESPGDASAHCCDDLKPPAYTASGCHFFRRYLSHPLLARRDGHTPQQLRKPAAPLHNPRGRGIGGE